MPCSKCFTCINSFNLCSKSLRWLHHCHDFTDCGIVRSPEFPQGHQISKWQSCDLIINCLPSESKQLITCSSNPNIADTVTIATVHGVLFMTGAHGLKKCILIPAKKTIYATLLR